MPAPHAVTRLGLALLTAAALLQAAPAATADTPAPAPGGEPGWTAEPAAGSAGAAPRPYFYLSGTPGAVLEDRLALANPTDQEHTVTLRGADAYNTPDGAFAVRPADASTGAGSWIGFGPGASVRIPPRTRALVPFAVTVPPGAAPGDHPAAVVATEGGHEVGVRVHLRVGGPSVAALTVEDVAVHGRGAATTVGYTLVNRGNVALTPELALGAEGRLTDAPGRSRHPLPLELLPGQRVTLSEPWPGAPAFDAVRLTVTVTAPGAAPATATASAWFLPGGTAAWTGLGLLALGATTTAALLLVRTRRVGPRPPARDEPVREEPQPTAEEHELTGAPR